MREVLVQTRPVEGSDGGVVLMGDDGEDTRRICDVKLS